ncbi:MAG: TM1266 family iron-only hydrogenase system putative regulator [Anaerovoracaceae bacterium]|jgi:putative iron-only hydrogenase system regulator
MDAKSSVKEGKRLGILGIFVEDLEQAEKVNAVLHEYRDIVVARMGIPYKERNLSVMSLILDGESDEVNAMTGKLGRIPNVSVRTMLAKNRDGAE